MIIKIDTREKLAWDFSSFEDCEGQINEKLPTGDYTIIGYEDIIIIDRKKSVSELYSNLRGDYKRFKKELSRMTSFKMAYFLLEFSLEDIFNYKFFNKCSSKSILEQIDTIEKKYNVKFIFSSGRDEAQEIAMELFRKCLSIN